MQFIKAEKKDIHRILLLAWDIWQEWYWPVIGPEQLAFMLDVLYNPDSIGKQMEDGQEFFILSVRNRDAGFLAIRQASIVRLEKLYLKSDYRGQGIGLFMLNFAAEQAINMGKGQMQLNVNRFNPALGFYLANGFEILRQEDIPFGPFFLNDFVLSRNLSWPDKASKK